MFLPYNPGNIKKKSSAAVLKPTLLAADRESLTRKSGTEDVVVRNRMFIYFGDVPFREVTKIFSIDILYRSVPLIGIYACCPQRFQGEPEAAKAGKDFSVIVIIKYLMKCCYCISDVM